MKTYALESDSTMRIHPHHQVVTAVLGVGLAIALGGCSGSEAGTSAPPTAALPTEAHSSIDTLAIAFPAAITSTDPLLAGLQTDLQILHLLGGNLYEFSSDNESTAPALAESGEFGPKDKTFTLTMRPDARFTDGSRVLASDVVATFERAKTLETNAYAGQFTAIDSATAADESTVEFVFNRSFPSFTTLMAYPSYTILKASEIAQDNTIPTIPTFAGAYIPAGKTLTGNNFSLRRNDNYVGVRPAVEELEFRVVGDSSARYEQLSAGQFDFAVDVPPVSLRKASGDVLPQLSNAYGFSYLALNNQDDLMSDPRIRRAISLALDRTKIADIAWSGFSEPLGGFFSSPYGDANVPGSDADVTAAKAELKGTACESGCQVDMIVPAGLEWATQSGTLIQAQLGAIGIDVKVESADFNTAVGKLFGLEYQMVVSLFTDYSAAPEGMPNYCMAPSAGFLACGTAYESDEADELVSAAATAPTDGAREDVYGEIQELFATDMPFATLSDYVWTAAVTKSSGGVIAVPSSGLLQIAPLKG